MCKSEHIDNMLLLPGPFGRLRHGAQWPNGLETLSIRACVSVRVCVRVCVCARALFSKFVGPSPVWLESKPKHCKAPAVSSSDSTPLHRRPLPRNADEHDAAGQKRLAPGIIVTFQPSTKVTSTTGVNEKHRLASAERVPGEYGSRTEFAKPSAAWLAAVYKTLYL